MSRRQGALLLPLARAACGGLPDGRRAVGRGDDRHFWRRDAWNCRCEPPGGACDVQTIQESEVGERA